MQCLIPVAVKEAEYGQTYFSKTEARMVFHIVFQSDGSNLMDWLFCIV